MEANKAVERVLQGAETTKRAAGTKRKYTSTFTPEDRAEIGKYAAENGNTRASKKYCVAESTVRLFKSKYLAALKTNTEAGIEEEVRAIPAGKRGRPLLLGELDKDVQKYISALRDAGVAIGTKITIAAAEGIIMAHNRSLLVQHGGYIELTRDWALSLLNRMGFVKRKATTKAKSQHSGEEFQMLKKQYLQQVVSMIKVHNIPESLVINLDQTGLNLVPSGDWTMSKKGAKRVGLAGLGDKRQITATFAATLSGQFLPMQLLYTGKTDRCHPKQAFPNGFDVFHTPNHWANAETCERFMERILLPYVTQIRQEKLAPDQYALLIMDRFSGQKTDAVLSLLEENKIMVVFVPPGTTDKLQPLDLSANKAAKDFLRQRFHHWYADQVKQQLQSDCNASIVQVDMRTIVMKELGVKWLSELYDYLRGRPEILVNGFKEAGIVDALQCEEERDIDPFSDI